MKKMNVIGKAKQRVVLAGIIGILGIAPAIVGLAAYLPGATIASAATVDIDILSNRSSSNSTGTSLTNPWPADGQTRTVNFTISGSQAADISAIRAGQKQVYLGVPTELTGKVSTNGSIAVDSNITLDLDRVSFLKPADAAIVLLTKQITKVLNGSVGSLTGVTINVDDFNQKLEAFKNIEEIGNVTFDVDSDVVGAGKFINGEMDDGLGTTVAGKVRQILLDLKAATLALHATGSGFPSDQIAGLINGTLIPPKEVLVQTIDAALPLLEENGQAVGELAYASILGDTTIVVPTKITSPTATLGVNNTLANDVLDLKFPGVAIQTNQSVDKLVTYFDDLDDEVFSHVYISKK